MRLGPRVWALAVQLYGVRSRRNWGHGDFTDLADLDRLRRRPRRRGIGLNPLHALFDDRPEASPYFPNSRLFLNPLYIDVEAIPEFPRPAAAEFQSEHRGAEGEGVRRLRRVSRRKAEALRARLRFLRAQGATREARSSTRSGAQRGSRSRLSPLRVAAPALRAAVVGMADRVAEADRARLASSAHRRTPTSSHSSNSCSGSPTSSSPPAATRASRGLPIGLYLDLAVGVRPDGFDAWSEQDFILPTVEIGAPPDPLNTAGQNWGLAGVSPVGLRRARSSRSATCCAPPCTMRARSGSTMSWG